MAVERIFLSCEDREKYFSEYPNDVTDAIVRLDSQENYIATFFTFEKIAEMKKKHIQQNDFLGGKYFWQSNMILVEICERDTIEQVIQDLWDEGNFFKAFKKL